MLFREVVIGLRRAWSQGGVAVESIKSIAVKGSFLSIQVVTSILLARSLGPVGFGDYSLAITVVALLVVVAELGFPSYLVRMVAAYRGEGHTGLIAKLVKWSLLLVLATSLLTVALASVSLTSWLKDLLPLSKRVITLALILVPAMAILDTAVGAMRGMGFVIGAELYNQVFRPGLFLACVALIYVNRSDVNVPSSLMLAVNVAVTGITAGVSLRALFLLLGRSTDGSESSSASPFVWLRGSLPFLFLASAQMLNHHIDTLMIGILLNQEQVGLYRVAVQLSDGAQMILMAISVVIGPRLAYLHARGGWDQLERLLVKSHQLGFVLILPIAGIFFLGMGEFLVTLVFGSEYADSVASALILLMGKLAYALVGYCGLAVSMFGYPSVATWTVVLLMVVNGLLNAALIPVYGIEGAAFATIVSQFALNALLAIWMKGRFGRSFTPLGAMIDKLWARVFDH